MQEAYQIMLLEKVFETLQLKHTKVKRRHTNSAKFCISTDEKETVISARLNEVPFQSTISSLSLFVPLENNSELLDKAKKTLDKLKLLQLEILTGKVSSSTLEALHEYTLNLDCNDPTIKPLIDELKVRTSVELAKAKLR